MALPIMCRSAGKGCLVVSARAFEKAVLCGRCRRPHSKHPRALGGSSSGGSTRHALERRNKTDRPLGSPEFGIRG